MGHWGVLSRASEAANNPNPEEIRGEGVISVVCMIQDGARWGQRERGM